MRHVGTLAVLALASAPLGANAAGKAVPAGIEQQVKAWESAFNAQDAKKIGALFVEDGTFVNPMGARAEGRAAIEQRLSQDFQGPLRGATATARVVGARLLGKDYAFVEVEQEVSGPNLPAGTPRPGVAHVPIVMKRAGNGWKLLDVRPHFWIQRPTGAVTGSGDATGAPATGGTAAPTAPPADTPTAAPGETPAAGTSGERK